MFCLAAPQRRPVQQHSRWFVIVPLRDPPSLSLSRIKGVSGCSVGLYPPRGSNPPLRNRRGVLYPLYYDELLSSLCCTAAQTCSALSLCLPLSLSLSVSRSLSPSSPLLCSLSSPSPGVFLVPLPLLTLPYKGWGVITCQVEFAMANFAVGNFAQTPGFGVANFADTPRNVVVRRALWAW